ncbi:MAG: hypothetical protein KAQ83_04125 [Nanoarchaeota archaeon]|nr:hypothetical protein [Nanoarchaeota archaeon]
MKIILDTNIILSALIKNSITREIIVKSEWDFYYPKLALSEIKKYENLIITKAKINKNEYLILMQKLFRYIRIIQDDKIKLNLCVADKIMGHIDPKDVIFVASNLYIEDSIIWSDDKDFDKQNKVTVMKTNEILDIFRKI